MTPIRVTVQATGVGTCALTGKESDGLTVAFENEPPTFLSWKALRQLVTMKAGGQPKLVLVPNGTPVVK